MDLGFREIVIVVVGIALLVLVADAVRRSLKGKEKLPFSMGDDHHSADKPDPLLGEENPQGDIFKETIDDLDFGGGKQIEIAEDILGQPRAKEPSGGIPAHDQIPSSEAPKPGPALFESTPPTPSLTPETPELLPAGEFVGKPRVKVSNGTQSRTNTQTSQAEAGEIDDAVVLFVKPKHGSFRGAELRTALAGMGLSHGERDLFHLHSGGTRDILYSVANATQEGTFPQGAMEGFTSPGLVLAMQLNDHVDPEHGFEVMISCARQIARRLDGEVLDSHQAPLSGPFTDEAKQRVRAVAKAKRLAH